MKARLWIGLMVLAFLALVTLRFQDGSEKMAASQGNGKAKAGGALSIDEELAMDVEELTKGRPKETALERRARLVAMEGREDFKLSEQEIYLYLQANQSNAVSLVTAFEASNDKEFLKIAAERFPKDAFVQAKVLMHDVFPEDRGKWIAALKLSAKENSLPWLMAMSEAINRGDVQQAMEELKGANGKSFDDYSARSSRELEKAYLSAGRSELEAKVLGSAELRLAHLPKMNSMVREMIRLAEIEAKEGNVGRQVELLKGAWDVGAHLRDSTHQPVLITDLVGISAQMRALRVWPADYPAEFLARPVSEEMKATEGVRNQIKESSKLFDPWFQTAPDEEVMAYFDRIREFGEQEALKWLREKHPELAQSLP